MKAWLAGAVAAAMLACRRTAAALAAKAHAGHLPGVR
jgi:hypothetical protein